MLRRAWLLLLMFLGGCALTDFVTGVPCVPVAPSDTVRISGSDTVGVLITPDVCRKR